MVLVPVLVDWQAHLRRRLRLAPVPLAVVLGLAYLQRLASMLHSAP